jgi:antitoxin component YwqK of YwqJK toxin-antitoxin module
MTTVNYNDANLVMVGVDSGGSDMFEYNGQPFTGTIEEYDGSNNLIAEMEYVNGYVEGIQKFYHANGQLEEEYRDLNNIAVDYYKYWNDQGYLIYHATFDNKGSLISTIVDNR